MKKTLWIRSKLTGNALSPHSNREEEFQSSDISLTSDHGINLYLNQVRMVAGLTPVLGNLAALCKQQVGLDIFVYLGLVINS